MAVGTTWTDPTSGTLDITTGQIWTQAAIEGILGDLNYLGGLTGKLGQPVPCVRAFNSADISVASATVTALTLNSTRYDTDNTMHDPVNTSRLVCRSAGRYHISANIQWAGNATGQRQLRIVLNNSVIIGWVSQLNNGAGIAVIQSVGCDYTMVATDYVEIQVYQDSGGALNINTAANYSPEFSMYRIGG